LAGAAFFLFEPLRRGPVLPRDFFPSSSDEEDGDDVGGGGAPAGAGAPAAAAIYAGCGNAIR
jgi:hypothetical protein